MTDQPAPQAPAADVTVPAPPPAPGLVAWLARHGYAVLALVCLLLWAPGILSLPALDRDESRFAESSRQMLDSGNYVDIRFGQVPRYKKPVGIYWLQAATTAIAGPLTGDIGDHSRIWTYRLPSLLGGMAAAMLTFWCGSLFSAEAGPEIGLFAGLLVAASLLLTGEATQATTDAALLATVMLTQGVLFRLWRAAREGVDAPSLKLVMAGWAALAVGILLKGPVTPGVAAMTLIVLIGWERWEKKKFDLAWLAATRPLRGVALAVVITAPWLIAIAIQSHGAFFQQSLGGDFAAKVAEGQEGHGAPPGYYLLVSSLTFWPAILFVLPGIGLAMTRRSEAPIRFLIAWAAGWWLLVELVPTKLPNYVLPSLPPLAILAALWLTAAPPKGQQSNETGWRRFLPLIAAAQAVAGLAALSAAPFLLPARFGGGDAPWPFLVAAGLGGLLGLVGLILLLTGRRTGALAFTMAASLILIPNLTSGIAPLLTQFWFSRSLAQAVAKDRQPYDPPPRLAGYEEPSLVFALGADVALTDGRGAAELGLARGGLALVDDAERPSFLARLAELQGDADAVDAMYGFNYSRGRTTHVTLYRIAPLTPVTRPLTR